MLNQNLKSRKNRSVTLTDKNDEVERILLLWLAAATAVLGIFAVAAPAAAVLRSRGMLGRRRDPAAEKMGHPRPAV